MYFRTPIEKTLIKERVAASSNNKEGANQQNGFLRPHLPSTWRGPIT